jgi:nitrogen fixation protein NifU and related proteins
MSELRDLYQQVILDHNRKPRNFGRLERPNRTAEGYNPLCGDRIQVYLEVDNGVIRDIRFEGSGCAISKAAASMMTASLKGMTVPEAERLFGRFHEMLTTPADTGAPAELGKLAVFSGVCEFPSRIKCATLPWHTVHAALAGTGEPVSTE